MNTITFGKDRWLPYTLGALQALIGLSAIAGGLRLVMNPGGTGDIPIEWLNQSPFASYLIPGVVLIIAIGFGNVLASIVTFMRKNYSGYVAAAFSVVLIGFMTVEIWFVGLRNFLQPLYLVLGFIGLIIGMKLKDRKIQPEIQI